MQVPSTHLDLLEEVHVSHGADTLTWSLDCVHAGDVAVLTDSKPPSPGCGPGLVILLSVGGNKESCPVAFHSAGACAE